LLGLSRLLGGFVGKMEGEGGVKAAGDGEGGYED